MASGTDIRAINEVRVLGALFQNGGCSRADLARQLDLTRATTGSIVATLAEENLVLLATQSTSNSSATGRPGMNVTLNADGAMFLGAEIGVDRITIVVVNLAAEIVHSTSQAYETSKFSAQETIATLCKTLKNISKPFVDRVRGIAICVPGLLDNEGLVRSALFLNWSNVRLPELVRVELNWDIPLDFENDANAFALAEIYGKEVDPTDTRAFYNMETGVGGGIVLGGRLFRGGHGLAGELGHVLVGTSAGEPKSYSTFIENLVGKETLLSIWHQTTGRTGDMSDLISALEEGCPKTRELANEWGRQVGSALVQVVAVLDPNEVVLGGSVSALLPYAADIVASNLQDGLIEGFAPPPVRRSELGIEGAALGCALLMHQKLFT